MEAFEEAIAASKEQSMILKGKRTKRQRPQSPIPFSISPPLASSIEEEQEEEESIDLDSKDKNVENRKKDGVLIITSSSSSASWSSNNNQTLMKPAEEVIEEEEQDIANCLILLAQGHSLPPPSPHHQNNNHQLKIIPNQETNRFTSRRFLETSSNSGAKAGYYVYQCKTCDRTFPSFQALGGHRASHKKPKASTSSFYSNLDNNKKNIYENDAVSLVTTTSIYNKRSLVVYGKSSKVHECGICGAEFTSGQALGGHMRRHRGAVVVAAAPIVTVSAAANTELSLSPMSFDQISLSDDHNNLMVMPEIKRAKKNVVSLDLDLNLPAPDPENENRVNGFNFASKQKHEQEEPKSLVLSSATPTLVDCHY